MIRAKIRAQRTLIRESWAISWPMTLIMFALFLIGLADVYVAGKFGKEVQAAYGVASQLYFIFSILAFALTVGTVSLVSRLFTSGKNEEFLSTAGSALISALAGGAVMAVAGFAAAGPLSRLMNIPAQLKDSVAQLTRIYSLGLVFAYLLINSNGVLRGCTMIKRSLLTMAVVCVLNTVLNFVLAFRTPLGYSGIAYATVISTVAGCLINFVFMLRLVPGSWRFSRQALLAIAHIGWPAGLLQVLWQLGLVTLYMVLAALPQYPIETMAAFTNGLKVESAIFLSAFAFNMAAAVIVGNLLGAKKEHEAFKSAVITAAIGTCVVGALSLLAIFAAPQIASLLSDNPVVIAESVRYIRISLLLEPVMAWGVILSGGLNGAGDTRAVMLIASLSVWLVRLPLAFGLGVAAGWGAAAIWWAMNLSVIVQTVFMTRRYFSKRWMRAAQHMPAIVIE